MNFATTVEWFQFWNIYLIYLYQTGKAMKTLQPHNLELKIYIHCECGLFQNKTLLQKR